MDFRADVQHVYSMREPLPILYAVNPSVAVTGGFTALRSMARLLKNDVRIVMVLPQGSSIAADQLQDFYRVEYLPLVNLSKRAGAILRYVPSLLRDSWRLSRAMKRDGTTRLMLNDFYVMHGAVLRLLGFRGHIVSWVRADPKHLVGVMARPMLALTKHSANRIVAVSTFIETCIPAHYATDKIYDCYHGATRAPRVWGAGEEKTFVSVGNYIAGKGQEVALAAFAKAAAQNSTLRLAFYGGDMGLVKNRAYRESLEAFAQQHGLADRVQFHDAVADSFPILSTAFAALNCSVSESFSLTVLEASGAGVPVIATASGGPQEILSEGITGYLVPVGDVDAIAARMLSLAADPALAARMGEAGAAHIQQYFSPTQQRAQLLAALNLH